MASLNKVVLIGPLGADPDVRYLPDGAPVASLRWATTETWKDQATGEKREQTERRRLSLFRGLADIAGQSLRKGAQVYVEGRLRTRKWTDPAGVDRTTEITVDEIKRLGRRPEGTGAGTADDRPAETAGGGGNFDDIPFARPASPGRAGVFLRGRVKPPSQTTASRHRATPRSGRAAGAVPH